MDGGLGLFLLVLVNIPLYVFVGRAFFGTAAEFQRCIYFWLKPDVLSWIHGEYWEDHWAEMKLGFYFVVCFLLVWCEYGAITKVFGA